MLHCGFGRSRWGGACHRKRGIVEKIVLYGKQRGQGVCEFCIQQAVLQQVVLQLEKFPGLGQVWTVVPWRDKKGRRNAWFGKRATLIQCAAQQRSNLTKERFLLC